MKSIFLLLPFLWVISLQSELKDILSSADQLFQDFFTSDHHEIGEEELKDLLKRSYNLDDEAENHQVLKRSLDFKKPLVRDKHGVFMLSNIQEIMKIPAKFPNDINIISSHNLLYITTLEANGNNPETELANELALFQYSSISGIRKIKGVPVLGGVKTAFYSFRNTTFLISAEHNAEKAPELFQGSTIYKLVERMGRIHLEKIQILNVIQPNDVQFWEYQDQLYLIIGTNMGNDTTRTGTLVYRWLGFHFDCLQIIPGKHVKSVTPFSIGSFMYLAVAYFQDENGNPDIESEIFLFSLEETKFKSFQKLKTHGANGFSYFKFEDTLSREKEHFLVVANSQTKTPQGTPTSLTESVIYKFTNNYFVPFQSFRLHGVTQWLPVRGYQGEFLLLATYSNGVIGFQYDGWRFSQISLKLGQSSFGENIQSMRAFQYLGDNFLTIADKSSYGNKVNLWKLSFTHKNDLESKYHEVENWCSGMSKKMSEDNLDEILKDLKLLVEDELKIEKKTEGENLEAGDYNEELRDELEKITEKTLNLEKLLKEAEDEVGNRKHDSEIPIELGSNEIEFLEIKCTTPGCCEFKNLTLNNINGENLHSFLENVVFLDEGVTDTEMEFENVILDRDLSPSFINEHPSETLVDISATTFLNEEIFVNGTTYIKGDLSVNGLFNGIKPDEENLLLSSKNQNIPGKLYVENLEVKNLKLSGNVNSEPLERLLRKSEINLRNTYRDLNVNNLYVKGLVSGHNISEIFEEALRKTGNQQIQGDLEVDTLEAEEVVVDSDTISNGNVSKLLQIFNEHQCESEAYINPESPRSNGEESKHYEEYEEFIVIVEGEFKAKDISDHSNSISLLDVLNNSYKLNETVIDSEMEFSNIIAEDLNVGVVNGVPVNSWVLKNSDVAFIKGRKKFQNGINIEKEVFVEKINGIDMETFSKDVMKLEGDQVVPADLEFDTVTCQEIETTSAYFGNKLLDQLNRLELKQSVTTDFLQMGNLTITGTIDSLSWDDLVENSVINPEDEVAGEKTIKGNIQVENLNVSGKLNDLMFEDFMTLTSSDANKILLDSNVTVHGHLTVDELHFEGLLDSTLKPRFQYDWLLQNETQIITGPITFENVEMKSGSNLMNETVNNISIRKLFSRSLKIDEDTKIKHLFTMDKIKADRMEIGGTLNGADFGSSILRSKGRERQEVSGEWLLGQGLTVEGSLIVEGFVSGLNLTRMCEVEETEKISLVVGGSLQLMKEPTIRLTTNGINIQKKMQEVWMGNENTTLKGADVNFENVEFLNKTTLGGKLNNANLTQISRFYLSKTKNRVISADYEFDNLIVRKSCRMRTAKVGGNVNGVNLTHWANNVLLQDEDQIIREALQFDIFEISDIDLRGKVNGLDLGQDVLRMDVEDVVVEGEKTFHSMNVHELKMAEGRKVQNVDVDLWRNNQIKTTGGVIINGNLTLKNAHFEGPFTVHGKVNDIYFDNAHLLTTGGNQVVTGIKRFTNTEQPMRIRYFEASGPIGGVDFEELRKSQAYIDQDLVFTQPKTFDQGLEADSVEVDGLFQGVDVSGMCNAVRNPVDVNVRKEDFFSLMNHTKALVRIVKERAYFFDYFELIQTLKPNVKAVVPTMDAEKHFLLTVFTPTMMRFMEWNKFSESFTNTDEGLSIIDDITFVTSELSSNSSLLYIESSKSTRIFQTQNLKEIQTSDTSCIAFFYLKPLEKTCIFIGQKRNSSRIMCNSVLMNDLQTYQWLESKGSVQATAIAVGSDIYIAVINKEEVFDKIENTLMIYRFDSNLQHFHVTHTLAEVNPVAVASIEYKNNYYLVSAGGHLPESVHNSVLSIFKFSRRHKAFIRSQSIRVDTPVDVHFALLPSSELALYVLTSNPTKPFVVFLHKGVSGFVEETSGLSLYPGTNLYSFTNSNNEHFVVVSGFGRGQILKAGFKGDKDMM